MAGRHFDGYLPDRVTFLEDDLIGTKSGNPTSQVVYGFRKDRLDQAPHFAVVNVLPKPSPVSEIRTVRAVGPLFESEYSAAMADLSDDDINAAWKDMQEKADERHFKAGAIPIEITVPRMRPSEFIIGHALNILFE